MPNVPYRAFGYPIVPALYIVGAATILLVLFIYKTSTTWPGLVIVLLGVPVYFAVAGPCWRLSSTNRSDSHEAMRRSRQFPRRRRACTLRPRRATLTSIEWISRDLPVGQYPSM